MDLMPGDDPLMGRTIAGRFTITDYLGAGGMGTVYKATQAHIDRVVALKVLKRELADNEETVERFRREAKAASLLKNPHTVTLFDFGQEDDGLLFLAMEFLEGETLTEQIYEYGPFPWRDALSVARQVAGSLREAHEQGIVHRDLKPDNIFLDREVGGEVRAKVLDFGIARLVQTDESEGQTLTQAGMVFGTPGYMSPEQAQGKRVDSRADLYSLGVVLFEMLTGVPLYEAESVVMLMGKHIAAPVPTISERAIEVEVPPVVEALVGRLLAKHPEERCQTAQEILASIDSIMGGGALPELSRLSSQPRRGSNVGADTDDIGWAQTTPQPGFSPPGGGDVDWITGDQPAAVPLGLASTASSAQALEGTIPPELAQPRSKLPLLIVLVSVILVAAGVGVAAALGVFGGGEGGDVANDAVVANEPPEEPTPTPVKVENVEPAPAQPVDIEIRAEPASAEIWLDGERLEGNPHKAKLIPSSDRYLLVVKAAGYVTREREVTFDRGRSLEIVLREAETEPASDPDDRPRRGDRPSRPAKTKRPRGSAPIITESPFE